MRPGPARGIRSGSIRAGRAPGATTPRRPRRRRTPAQSRYRRSGGDPKSRITCSCPACSCSNNQGSPWRAPSGRRESSTFTTSAPHLPRRWAQSGPAHMAEKSTTRQAPPTGRDGLAQPADRPRRHVARRGGHLTGREAQPLGLRRQLAGRRSPGEGLEPVPHPAGDLEVVRVTGRDPAQAERGQKIEVVRTGQGDGHPTVGGPEDTAPPTDRRPTPTRPAPEGRATGQQRSDVRWLDVPPDRTGQDGEEPGRPVEGPDHVAGWPLGRAVGPSGQPHGARCRPGQHGAGLLVRDPAAGRRHRDARAPKGGSQPLRHGLRRRPGHGGNSTDRHGKEITEQRITLRCRQTGAAGNGRQACPYRRGAWLERGRERCEGQSCGAFRADRPQGTWAPESGSVA